MDTAKLQNRTQEIAIHPDKKIEFSRTGRVSTESRLLPKITWEQEQEVNSKKSEKDHSCKN